MTLPRVYACAIYRSDIGYLRVIRVLSRHINSIRLTEMNKNRENKVDPNSKRQIDLLTTFIRLAWQPLLVAYYNYPVV